jgi:hypothetical protein
MIEINIDEKEVRKLYLEKLEEHLNKIDKEMVYWNTCELERQTNMCINTMKKEFFYDERFPKRKKSETNGTIQLKKQRNFCSNGLRSSLEGKEKSQED